MTSDQHPKLAKRSKNLTVDIAVYLTYFPRITPQLCLVPWKELGVGECTDGEGLKILVIYRINL